MAPHLVDRREAGLESAARGAEVQPPAAGALCAREPGPFVDARDRVEAVSSHLAVVDHTDVDQVADARGLSAFARDLRLRLAQRDAGDVHAVLLRRVDHPAAPAAADIEHALAGLQVQLGAYQ